MSYDSDENGGGSEEWEVVDIVHTTTSAKPDKKLQTAKKEDVDNLAADIHAQLSLKTTQDTQQILLLEQKMKQQQKMSEHQLVDIQSRLSQITRVQHEQETQQRSLDQQRKDLEQRQKQQLLEQKVAIQSLSDHQIQTQKQIEEAKEQIKSTNQQMEATATATDHNNNQNNNGFGGLYQTSLIHAQAPLSTFNIPAQGGLNYRPSYGNPVPGSAYDHNNGNSNRTNGGDRGVLSSNLREIEENLKKLKHNHSNYSSCSNSSNTFQSQNNHSATGMQAMQHANGAGNGNSSWMPSFFAFGGNKHPTDPNASLASHNVMQPAPPHVQQNPYMSRLPPPPFASMADTSSTSAAVPPATVSNLGALADMGGADFREVTPPPNLSPPRGASFANAFQNAFTRLRPSTEEKSNVLADDCHEDDDDVLRWNNDYGPAASGPVPQQPHNILYKQPHLLKTASVIGEGKFMPNEKRQCGWVVTNKSKVNVKAQATLECVGGDEEERGIKITADSSYDVTLKPNEQAYILVEVQAPSIAGRYCAFYQLAIDGGHKVGEMLEVTCQVEAQFSPQKETKIATIIKMGFDRKQVITTLQANKWDVQRSVNTLLGL